MTASRRYFYPWDPLQLSTDVDSGLRVKKNAVMFSLYRTPGRKVLWTPLVHSHLVNFYGEESEVETMVSHMVNQSKKIPNECYTMTFYSIGGHKWDIIDKLDQECAALTSLPYEESPRHFLESLECHVSELETKAAKLNVVEAPNKQVQIVMASFTDDAWNELVDDEQSLLLLDGVLNRASKQRVYVWLLTRSGDAVPELLLRQCSYGFFLGEENCEFAENYHFPGVEVDTHAFGQKFSGVGWKHGDDLLIPLHPLKFTPSDYALAKKQAGLEEEELYRRFLATLSDGEEE